MTTYFARHTKRIDIDQETRDLLWREQWVAIHYNRYKDGHEWYTKESVSWDPAEYPENGKKPLRALMQLAEEGGYVCATYGDHDTCLVGYVAPHSAREIIEGRRGSMHGVEGRCTLLKGVRLQRVKEVVPRHHTGIFVGAPQQTTLTRWVAVKSRIEDLVEVRVCRPSLDTLTEAELETLCAEFLRIRRAQELGLPRLSMLLLPVGRTMKDIDIYGLADDGKPIYSQVTYGLSKSSQRGKTNVLRKYVADDNHVVFFGSYDMIHVEDGVLCCPITTVYEHFSQTLEGQTWINFKGGVRDIQ